MKRIREFLMLLFAVFVIVVLYEVIGQNLLFRDKLYFVNDVDHRMKPESSQDINPDGIRSTVEADQFREEDLNIIFLGDSFIYGFRLPYDQTIPHRLERKARSLHPGRKINVANFGWTSSSPLLSLRLLKDIGKKYNPDIVMLAIDMTDFQDDIKYSRLLERKGIYRALDLIPITILTLRKVTSRIGPLQEAIFGWPGRRFFITDKPLSETRRYLATIRESIGLINEYTRDELGARFILFVLPRSYQYSERECPNNWEKSEYPILGPYADEPFKYFEELKEENVGYPIHSLLGDFQDCGAFPTCFDDDPHWNETGISIAVEAIYRYCLEDRCFD